MERKANICNEPEKTESLKELYKALEQMDDADRAFIAGAIALAGVLPGKRQEDHSASTNHPT